MKRQPMKILTVVCASVWLLAAGTCLVQAMEEGGSAGKVQGSTGLSESARIANYAQGIRGGTFRYFLSNKLDRVQYALKLDFSPDSLQQKDDGSIPVFNPDSGVKLTYLPPTQFRGLEKGSQYHFTAGNRIEGLETDAPELIMVISNVRRDICGDMNKGLGLNKDGSIIKLETEINLASSRAVVSEQNIVNLPAFQWACFETPTGKLYYVHTLIAR